MNTSVIVSRHCTIQHVASQCKDLLQTYSLDHWHHTDFSALLLIQGQSQQTLPLRISSLPLKAGGAGGDIKRHAGGAPYSARRTTLQETQEEG